MREYLRVATARFALLAIVACGTPGPAAELTNHAAPKHAAPDRDGDGIPDDKDRCPDQAEDFDLFQDEDGCPDPDNDGDGVPDVADECPYEAGSNRGCAKPCRVIVTDSDDCFGDATVFLDDAGEPHAERMDAVVELVHANPSIQGLMVIGEGAELVARRLRARLPDLQVGEDPHHATGRRSVYVTIATQRYHEGRFSSSTCTAFGAIYKPQRPANCSL